MGIWFLHYGEIQPLLAKEIRKDDIIYLQVYFFISKFFCIFTCLRNKNFSTGWEELVEQAIRSNIRELRCRLGQSAPWPYLGQSAPPSLSNQPGQLTASRVAGILIRYLCQTACVGISLHSPFIFVFASVFLYEVQYFCS